MSIHRRQSVDLPRMRGARGSLRDFVVMPHDVVHEICKHLELRDVFNLSRTDKAFAEFLNPSNGMHVWKVAMSNVNGLPPCPSYMNEISYAKVLYWNCCHNCGKTNVRKIFHEWGVRYCQGCMATKTVKARDEGRFLREIASATGVKRPFCESDKQLLHVPTVNEFRKKWNELKGDKQGREKLAQDSAEDASRRREHAQNHELWSASIEKARKAEKATSKAERLEAIKGRLRGEGVDLDELDRWGYQLAHQCFADKTAPLIEREWPDIHGEVVGFVKYKRLQAQLEPLIEAFLDENILQVWEDKWAREANSVEERRAFARLRAADLLLMPEVKDALTSGMDELVVTAHLDIMGDELRPMLNRLHHRRRVVLNDMLRQARPALLQTGSPVELAVCVFSCADPRCPEKFMNYPRVFEHQCEWIDELWTDEEANVPADDYERVIQEYMANDNHDLAWHKLHVRVSTLAYTPKAKAVVRACGKDPEFASPRELDECGVRVTCADCEDKGVDKETGYEVFDWRRALLHQIGAHHATLDTEPCGWKILTAETARKVRTLEDRVRDRPGPCHYRQTGWRCKIVKCRYERTTVYEYSDLVAHIRTKHRSVGDELVKGKHFEGSDAFPLANGIRRGIFIRRLDDGEVEAFAK